MRLVAPYRLFLILGIFLISKIGMGQQAWLYNLHQFNIFDVNHAYAGAYDELAVGMRYRRQWTGINGAPKTAQFSAHLPVIKQFSTGFIFRNEEIGAHQWNQMKWALSYRLGIRNHVLSFALTPSFWSQKWDISLISAKDNNDEILLSGNSNPSGFAVDFSVMYRSPKGLIGLQVNNLNQPLLENGNSADARLLLHSDLLAEYSFVTARGDIVKPTFWMRYTPNYTPSADFSLQYFWRETLWIGGGYRLGSTVFVMGEWQLNKMFRIGYSYDMFSARNLVSSSGSHEIFLGWNMASSASTPSSIRHFR